MRVNVRLTRDDITLAGISPESAGNDMLVLHLLSISLLPASYLRKLEAVPSKGNLLLRVQI
jgi:hypothetical protein